MIPSLPDQPRNFLPKIAVSQFRVTGKTERERLTRRRNGKCLVLSRIGKSASGPERASSVYPDKKMKIKFLISAKVCLYGLAVAVTAWTLLASQACPAAESGSHEHSGASRILTNGIEVRSREMILQVLALRDDVLRVRFTPNGEFPEDASWAVPADIRNRSAGITPESDDKTFGFHTNVLRVRIQRATLRLSVVDLEGHVLQEVRKSVV